VTGVNGEHNKVKALKDRLAIQPVSVGVATGCKEFMQYSSGIFDGHCGGKKEIGHAVNFVGWGIEGDKEFWIMRNSWSAAWGEEGYMRILISGDGEGFSAVQSDWSYPLLEGGGDKPKPDVSASDSPVGPVAPTEVSDTDSPVGPVAPTESSCEEKPVAPTESSCDEKPVAPTESSCDEKPVAPTESSCDEKPVAPTESSCDEKPVAPTESSCDEKPVAPTESSCDEKPVL
jgi:hypothetical protein